IVRITGQRHGERGALSQCTGAANGSSVGFHDLAYDRQSESRSLFCALPLIPCLEVFAENVVEVFSGNARARIADTKADNLALIRGFHDYRSALGRELERIGEKVFHHLANAFTIPGDES